MLYCISFHRLLLRSYEYRERMTYGRVHVMLAGLAWRGVAWLGLAWRGLDLLDLAATNQTDHGKRHRCN